MARDFEDLKDGSILEPFHINAIYRELRRWRKFKAAPPLSLQGADSSEAIPLLRSFAQSRGWLAVADGNISARSGTTAGTGKVKMVTISGTTLDAGTDSFDVVNPSATKMTSNNGIDSGQYCWVSVDSSGLLIVSPLECS